MKKILSSILFVTMLIAISSAPVFAVIGQDSDLHQNLQQNIKNIKKGAERETQEQVNKAVHEKRQPYEDLAYEVWDFDKINIEFGRVYKISEGLHAVHDCIVEDGTLIIGKDANVHLLGDTSFGEDSTLIVFGSIEFHTDDGTTLNGQVYVDGGKIKGSYSATNGVIDGHIIEDGICVLCGIKCPHANGFTNGKCNDCGYECSHTHIKTLCTVCGLEMGINSTGSTLSGGNIVIITAVAGVAFGLVCGLLIGKKKKKPVLANDDKKEIKD